MYKQVFSLKFLPLLFARNIDIAIIHIMFEYELRQGSRAPQTTRLTKALYVFSVSGFALKFLTWYLYESRVRTKLKVNDDQLRAFAKADPSQITE